MNFLKKLLGVREEVPETKIVTVIEGSEELTRRLQEFDNQALQNKIGMLEKVVTFLAQKIEVQSEVIRRQSDAIKQMHLTLEEIAHVFETVQKATVINQNEDDDDDEETETKKYLN
jgi:hypothetical protein